MVVDAEVNETNKTTLRSERSCVPEKKKKKEGKKTKKVLTRADIVRDVALSENEWRLVPSAPASLTETCPFKIPLDIPPRLRSFASAGHRTTFDHQGLSRFATMRLTSNQGWTSRIFRSFSHRSCSLGLQ